MKKKQLKSCTAVFAAAALILAGCTADELANGGVNNVSPIPGDVAKSGTVKFGNNTTMTIGEKGEGPSKAMTRSVAAPPENPSQLITMTDIPTYDVNDPETKVYKDGDELVFSYRPDTRKMNHVVPAGAKCVLDNKDFCLSAGYHVFVEGELKVRNYDGFKDVYVVLEGGVLDLSELDEPFEYPVIIDEGATVIWPESGFLQRSLNAEFSIMTEGDVNMGDGTLENVTNMFVGGDLRCSNITYSDRIDYSNTPCLYVGGDLWAENITLGKGTNLYVQGSLHVSGTLTLNDDTNLTVGCKLEAGSIVGSGMDIFITAPYIKSDTTFLESTSMPDPAIFLENGSVADLGDLTIEGHKVFFYLPDAEAEALIQCTDCHLYRMEDNDLSHTISEQFYFNYKTLTIEDAEGTPITAAPTKENVATINSWNGQSCSPGFTVKDEEGEEQPDTDGDITLDISSSILEDYTIQADDFAIRINGVYDETVEVIGEDGYATANLGFIQVTADQLKITLSGLNDANIQPDTDYTYEAWIWVKNSKLADDGTGAYVELFDADMKREWVGGQPGNDDDPYGEDVTKDYVTVTSPAGYTVRYNVYRGISGNPYTSQTNNGLTTPLGDTPYIKVSIHVQKDEDAPENNVVPIY